MTQALVLLAALLVFPLLRAAVLFRNSRALLSVSSRFPKEYLVGQGDGAALVYVALGDSTVLGTGVGRVEDTLPYRIAERMSAARHRSVRVINLGVTGATIADVRERQVSALPALAPDVVSLNCGANDATHGTSGAQFHDGLTSVLGSLESTQAREILIATTPDLGTVPAIVPVYNRVCGRRAAQQNRILYAAASGRPVVKIVDLYRDAKLRGSAMYASDDFHPSSAGYALWASLYPFPIKQIRQR